MGGLGEAPIWSWSSTSGELLPLLQRMDAGVGTPMRVLLYRAKTAGQLREDVGLTDAQVLAAAVQATVVFGGPEHPDLHRRMLHLVLDALPPARTTATPNPIRPLTEAELGRITTRTESAAENDH